ncbi:MAG: 50S ribosomal protein L23 [Candidatus Peribacteria bacterium]|jgi:large subunit ribosomal protein L23|nr:50S ribosomal protein L23 [Candidatus Peribacteria bacterium]
MRLYKILKKPIVTEKTANLISVKNICVFEVSEDATKIDIKKAVFEIY